MNIKKTITLTIASALLLSGCGDDNSITKEVETVQNGTMPDYPQVSIGDIFRFNFDNCKWRIVEENVRKYVVFEGNVSKKLSEKARSNVTPSINGKIRKSLFTDTFFENPFSYIPPENPISIEFLQKYRTVKDKIKEDVLKTFPKEFTLKDIFSRVKVTQLIRELASEADKKIAGSNAQESREIVDTHTKKVRKIYTLHSMLLEGCKNHSYEEGLEAYAKFKASVMEVQLLMKYREKFKKNDYFSVGENCEIRWTIFPDGKTFEFDSLSFRSGADAGLSSGEVLSIIYE